MATQLKGALHFPIAGVVATTGGAIKAIANPEGVPLIITRVLVDVTTESDGAANLTAGVAANGTTAADNLITATAVGSAPVLVDSADTTGRSRKWAADQFLNLQGSASTAGLVGTVYIEYIRA
jgi:hypothetical protein